MFQDHPQVAKMKEERRGEGLRLVDAYDGSTIFLAIVQRNLYLTCVSDNMIVGQNVTTLINNEPRALSFLRYESVEEIEGDRPRSNVHHCGDIVLIHPDIVLFL